jgi:hypothetical protein
VAWIVEGAAILADDLKLAATFNTEFGGSRILKLAL